MEETHTKVKNIIKGSELQTGARSKVTQVANTYANKLPNKVLSELFRKNMLSLDVDYPAEYELKVSGASTDFGNVSQVIPALSAYINIGDVILHSPNGTAMTGTEYAYNIMILGAKGLAYTAFDLLTMPDVLEASKREFETRIQSQ